MEEGGEGEGAIVLHPDQTLAVETAVSKRLSRITGPPGSGKSTILNAICVALKARGETALYLAPTGKAVQVVQESVGGELVLTIAKMETSPATIKKFAGGIVLVDESSMMGVALLDQILRELDPARLVLVGDPDQLSPIGESASVLGDLGKCGWCFGVALTRVWRQTAGTALFENLDLLRTGTHFASSAFRSDDSFRVRPRGSAAALDVAIDLLVTGCDAPPTIIVMTNETRQRLNKIVQLRINPRGRKFPSPYDGSSKTKDEIREGDPVVCRKNAYTPRKQKTPEDRAAKRQKGCVDEEAADAGAGAADSEDEEIDEEGKLLVANGAVGIACIVNDVPLLRFFVTDSKGAAKVFEDAYDFKRRRFKSASVQAGYAITVDASQGSGFNDVVVVLDDDKRSIGREHLYVGISRARNSCVLLCDEGSVQNATRPQRKAPSQFLAFLQNYDFQTHL
jgi:ATP-dependent exoDNAse (exonuclease V) alpha subunit